MSFASSIVNTYTIKILGHDQFDKAFRLHLWPSAFSNVKELVQYKHSIVHFFEFLRWCAPAKVLILARWVSLSWVAPVWVRINIRMWVCIIISQSIAGKTSLLITASTNSFPSDCIPTLYDSLDVHVQVTLLSVELLHNQLAMSLISTCRYQTDKGHLLLDVCRDLNF